MARNLTEVADPNAGKIERLYTKWEKFGDFTEGHLIQVEKIDGKYGEKTVYDFVADDGATFTVSGSAYLKAKLDLVAVGVFVRVEYVLDRPTKKGNPMKVFRVQTDVSDRKSEAQIAEILAAVAAEAKDSAAVPF